MEQHFLASYIQDNWRVNKRLTLNLGLRWDGMPHTYEANQQSTNFYPNLYNAADAATFDFARAHLQREFGAGVPRRTKSGAGHESESDTGWSAVLHQRNRHRRQERNSQGLGEQSLGQLSAPASASPMT